ncbi:MAG: HlyD family efflux transporter periplasmic adaptor subunit [Paramuribaculum sp.]|nr:HlyD family efflux transporter periplasmic adaptor subunit [Paramuribaculum sp.]
MDIQLKKKPWYVRHLSYIITGVAILALIVYVLRLAFSPRHLNIDDNDYTIGEVTEAPFMEYVDVEGIIHPIRTIQINAMESGFVERIVAEEGEMLNAGDTILILSNPELLRTIEDEQIEWQNRQRDYQEQEIAMEQRSITLRQQVLDAQHQISSLDKSLKQSREEYQMGIKSKAELDVLDEDYDYQRKKAQLQLQSLQHDSVANLIKRDMIRANREASSRKLDRSTKRTENLIVRAPISGQLSSLNVSLGQPVGTGASVGEIKVLTEYKVDVSLSEYYIDRITTGLPANISYQETKYPLRISRVYPEVKERNFSCDLLFNADKPSNIRLGKSYRVQIELARPEKAIVIPRGNFYQATSGRWIYCLSSDGKTLRKVDIELGRQNPKQFEVISGLKSGDKVLLSGYDKIGDVDEMTIN